MIIRPLAVVAFACASVVAQQRTLVVDRSAGPYTQISAAIAAARPGDRIEVHPGLYSGFTVTFGLEIVATAPGVQLWGQIGPVYIQNVPAANAVRLEGIELLGSDYFGPSQLQISGCAGIVHLHRITATGCQTTISSSGRVAITRSSLAGVSGVAFSSSDGGDALLLSNSSSAVLDSCVIGGGSGGSAGFWPFAGNGGSGLVLQQSDVCLTGCALTGGPGGSGYGTVSGRSGNGGNGVTGDAASTLRAAGNGSILGGWGGTGGVYGPGAPGVGIAPGSQASVRLGPGISYTPASTPVTAIPEPPHVIAPTTLPPGTTVAIQATGTTDQAVLLGIDIWNDLIRLPGVELPFVLTPAATLYAFAPPTTANSTTFSLNVPAVSWLLNLFVHLQAVTIAGNGSLQFSSGGYGRIM